MEDSPFVVVASALLDDAVLLIKNMCLKDIDNTKCQHNGIDYYKWNIDNKYYSAELNVVPTNDPLLILSTLRHSTEAFLFFSHQDFQQTHDEYQKWKPLIDNSKPEIKMLVYDYVSTSESDPNLRLAQLWCLKNGFELIDLQMKVHEDEDQLIKEAEGMERVIEALHSHTWPNLNMKSRKIGQPNESYFGEDAFEDLGGMIKLFAQLHSMKESVKSLPMAQRRECAEQVVEMFWKVMGEDESETGPESEPESD